LVSAVLTLERWRPLVLFQELKKQVGNFKL
jgi:hypothetical protein